MCGIGLFQNVCRSSMIANQVRDLLADKKAAAKITENLTSDLHPEQSVLRRMRPAGHRVDPGRCGLTGVMEEGGKHERQLPVATKG